MIIGCEDDLAGTRLDLFDLRIPGFRQFNWRAEHWAAWYQFWVGDMAWHNGAIILLLDNMIDPGWQQTLSLLISVPTVLLCIGLHFKQRKVEKES